MSQPRVRKRKWKTASVRKRWAYCIRVRASGTDHVVHLGQDRSIAIKKAGELAARPIPAHRMTLDDAAKQWLGSYVKLRRSASGQRDTAARYWRHVSPSLGWRKLASLTSEHVRDLAVTLTTTPSGRKVPDGAEEQVLAVQSQRHVLSDLRCLLLWATDAGLLDRSPFPRRAMPRLEERVPDRLTDEETDAVLQVGEPHGSTLRLALGTGLRWSELCRAARHHVEGDVLVVEKSKSGRVRRVPIGDPALLAEVRQRVGRLVPFAESSVGTFNRTIRRRTGLERFHVHQMRHTYACRFIERGGSLPALQQILGHASIVTTQRYARLSDEHVRAEALRVGGSMEAER